MADPQQAEASSAQERFGHARALAQDGDHDGAILEYRRLSIEHPDNVDYLFGEAQARFWSGQSACALRLASSARNLAPNYEDIWKLEYQVLRSMPGQEYAERLDAFRTAAQGRFPEATWFRSSPDGAQATYRWETGINRESLDNGAPDWQNVYAHVLRRSPTRSFLSLTLTEHQRFSRSDNEFALGAGFEPAESWQVHGAVSVAPDAQFLPDMVLDTGASRQLGNGWVAGIALRHRRYPDDTVNTYGANVEHYRGRFRVAYHLDNTRLASSSSFTHRGVLGYYAQSGSQYGVTVAAGDEVEVIAPGRLLEMDISAVALTGRHPLGERLSIHWRIGTHRQGSLYRRNNIGLSIAGEF